MAIPTPVNGQITDAVTQSNITVLGSAPAQAMALIFQAAAQAFATAAQNAVSQQQSADTLANAVTTRCVVSLLGASKEK
jgi:hypothetical protein